MGFGVPLEHWFRHELKPLAHDVLLGQTAQQRGYFRPEAVREMVTEHETGRGNHSYRLWALLVLELWMQRWLDSPATA
jgi:asparagine synthase (glutamine-hydrolysing)